MSAIGFIKDEAEENDQLVHQFIALEPQQFGYLQTLNVQRALVSDEDTWPGYEVVVELTSKDGEKYLHVEFHSVNGLQLGKIQGSLWHRVAIRSIKSDQWEGLNYRVVDDEEAAFAFYCKSFTAKVCDR